MIDNNKPENQNNLQLASQSNYSQNSAERSHIRQLQQNQLWSPIQKNNNSQNHSISANNISKEFYVNVLNCSSQNSYCQSNRQQQQQIKAKIKQNSFTIYNNLNVKETHQPLAQSNVNIILSQNDSPIAKIAQKNKNIQKQKSSQGSIQNQKRIIEHKLKDLQDLRISYKVTKLSQDSKINNLQKQISQLSQEESKIKSEEDNKQKSQKDSNAPKSQKEKKHKYFQQNKIVKLQNYKQTVSQHQLIRSKDSARQKYQDSIRSSHKRNIQQQIKSKQCSEEMQTKIKQMITRLKEQYKQVAGRQNLKDQRQKQVKYQKQTNQNKEFKVQSSILRYLQRQNLKETQQQKQLQKVKKINQQLSSQLSAAQSSNLIKNERFQQTKNQGEWQQKQKQLQNLKSQLSQKQFLLNKRQSQMSILKQKIQMLQNQKKKSYKLQEITKQFQYIKSSNVNLYQYTFDLQQEIAKLKDSRQESYIKMRKAIQKQCQQKLNKKVQQFQSKNKEYVNPKHKTTNQILLNELIHKNQILQRQINQHLQKNHALQSRISTLEQQKKFLNQQITKANSQAFSYIRSIKEKQAFIQQLQTKIFTIQEELLYLNQNKYQNKRHILNDKSLTNSFQQQQIQNKLIQRQQQFIFKENYLREKQKQLCQKQKELIFKQQSIYQIQIKVESQCRKMNMRNHQLQNQYRQILNKYNQIKKKQNTMILQKCNQYLSSNSQYGLKGGLNNYFKAKNNEQNIIQNIFTNKDILIQENTNRYVSQLSTSRSQRSRSNSLEADKIMHKMRANGNLISTIACNCLKNGVVCRCFANSRQRNSKLNTQVKSPVKLIISQPRRSPIRQNVKSAYYTGRQVKNVSHLMKKNQDKNIKLKIIEDKVKRIKSQAGILSK